MNEPNIVNINSNNDVLQDTNLSSQKEANVTNKSYRLIGILVFFTFIAFIVGGYLIFKVFESSEDKKENNNDNQVSITKEPLTNNPTQSINSPTPTNKAIVATSSPTVDDIYKDWKEIKVPDFGIVLKYPPNYTAKLGPKQIFQKDENNNLTKDEYFQNVEFYEGSKLILFSNYNPEIGNPYDCTYEGNKTCEEIYSKTFNNSKYSLSYDPNSSIIFISDYKSVFMNNNSKFWGAKDFFYVNPADGNAIPFNVGFNDGSMFTPLSKTYYSNEEFEVMIKIIDSAKQY